MKSPRFTEWPTLRSRVLLIGVTLFASLFTALAAEAQGTATFTATGTLASGYDTTGVFGTPNTDLTGRTASITYTFSQTAGTSTFSCAGSCTSKVTAPSGTATIAVNGVTANEGGYTDSFPFFLRDTSVGYYEIYYASIYSTVALSTSIPVTSFPPDFDWRSSFNLPAPQSSGSGISFKIQNANSQATGTFDPTTVTVTQTGPAPCSSAATFSVVNTGTGTQPNILGGNITNNHQTTVSGSVKPIPSSPISVIYSDNFALQASEPNDSSGFVPDGNGNGALNFVWQNNFGIYNDQITPSSCGTPGKPLGVYLVDPQFSSSFQVAFDFGTSQVDDAINQAAQLSEAEENNLRIAGPGSMPLLESTILGEPEQKGGLLVAKYGKGTYIYCAYDFFRQLPAGVPGAVRLFVNLVSGR